MPMSYAAANNLTFGVSAQAAAAVAAPAGQQVIYQYAQPSMAAPMPAMMQHQMPMVMQAQPGGHAPRQTVIMVNHQQQGIHFNSPGGTVYQPAPGGGYVMAPQAYSPGSTGGAFVEVAAALGTQVPAGTPGFLPSIGSSIHDGTGRCSPCAWFWKPRGCQSAANCGYCHICPEGELKNRKKAKVAAIRMGVVEPAQPKQSGLAQRPQATLNLNALL